MMNVSSATYPGGVWGGLGSGVLPVLRSGVMAGVGLEKDSRTDPLSRLTVQVRAHLCGGGVRPTNHSNGFPLGKCLHGGGRG
jgi:hypothetical protein